MRIAKFDRGLKEDRNLNNKDDEFHNIQGHDNQSITSTMDQSINNIHGSNSHHRQVWSLR